MGDWNFADVWECVAEEQPDQAAIVQGRESVSWQAFSERADRLAAWFLDQGVSAQDRVAQYLYNGAPYLESMFGIFKAGLVPVNTNYRYVGDELVHLWTDAGAVGVIYDQEFESIVDSVRDRVPGVKFWLRVPDIYDEITEGPLDRPAPVSASWGRSGDDLYMLYTGGTTGNPKGVLWRQDDWFGALNSTSLYPLGDDADPELVRLAARKPPPTVLPACPLMHGTGAGSAMSALSIGGTVVLLPQHRFVPEDLLDAVDQHGVKSVVLVGDAQARPLLDQLGAEPDRWHLSTLRVIISSGAILSSASKAALHAISPKIVVIDSLGSSEALGAASSISRSSEESHTGRFELGPSTKVITDEGEEVRPGSGEVGRLAVGGRLPLGYHNDEAKTAATFVTVQGARYSIAGDYATVGEDGAITFLGRGSTSINTGGEKVYPDEVESALKTHPAVADAAVVGVPDERFGAAVAALVELTPGHALDVEALRENCRSRIARYKVPRHVFAIDSLNRAANGKLDVHGLQAIAAELSAPDNDRGADS